MTQNSYLTANARAQQRFKENKRNHGHNQQTFDIEDNKKTFWIHNDDLALIAEITKGDEQKFANQQQVMSYIIRLAKQMRDLQKKEKAQKKKHNKTAKPKENLFSKIKLNLKKFFRIKS